MYTQLVQGDCRESTQLQKVFDGVDAVICILGTTAFPSARYTIGPLLLLDGPRFPCQPSYMQFVFCLSHMPIVYVCMYTIGIWDKHGDVEHDIILVVQILIDCKVLCESRTLWCCIGGKAATGQNRQTQSPPVTSSEQHPKKSNVLSLSPLLVLRDSTSFPSAY